MRDLAARLREVVSRERQASRELTYVADPDPIAPHAEAAARLGGVALSASHSCVMVERCHPSDRSHGRRSIESYAPNAGAPIHLFDARLAEDPAWWRRVVFFDTETTGLSGGAGTLAFLAGCGWFDDSGFVVRQFFLAGPAGERAMLDSLAKIFADASLLVTYNGRSFDVPLMETRWAFHRQSAPTDDLPHFDMLPTARRLWGRRDHDRYRHVTHRRSPLSSLAAASSDDESSCRLSTLERAVLGFHRVSDVPGFEIPARYFHFLRTGDAAAIEGVLEHNRHDLLSLAAVMSHALWLVKEGPDACREPSEQVAIGRIYDRAGQTDRARRAFEMAARTGDEGVRRHALARLALLFRREERYEESAEAWQGVLDMAPPGPMVLPVERRAAEALAIHHEHRAKDPHAAKRYATLLGKRGSVDGASRLEHQQVQHRLARLERKIQTGQEKRDDPAVVPLLGDEL